MKENKINFPPIYLESLIEWKNNKSVDATLVTGTFSDRDKLTKRFLSYVPEKDKERFQSKTWYFWQIESKGHIYFIVINPDNSLKPSSHGGLLEDSNFTFWKLQIGFVYQKLQSMNIKSLNWEFASIDQELCVGSFLGLELISYNYLIIYKKEKQTSQLKLYIDPKFKSQLLPFYHEAKAWGRGQNITRHLVNLPPSEAYPQALSAAVGELFKNQKKIKVHILNKKKLEEEKMGLLLGVGQGSSHEPVLVHLSYINSYKKNKNIQSVAIVGKGVTFDTGGLDIKPSSAMRLMKKDMAGAAAVIGHMWYLSQMDFSVSVEAYLPFVENSVDSMSMRPSDVLKSRNGQLVEIHNTDAEGRLILADAIDYALSQSNKPTYIIDIATLTGAIKTTLGLDISGLFSNSDDLAGQLLKAAQQSGDLTWRVPLYSKYASSFSTPFADVVNAVDGWASPITAALFLERFVKSTPWAHLDIYGWQEKSNAIQSHLGGNGQGVSLLNAFIKGL